VKSDLVCGKQKTILRMLMDWSLEIGNIESIRILAHNSESFASFFTKYFKDTEKQFRCKELNILIHNPKIDGNHQVIQEWYSLHENKNKNRNKKLVIRKAKISRRSFFGMVIEFEKHHKIGLIGFYEPLYGPQDEIKPYKRYGVFSQGSSSLLDVIDVYFDYYFYDNSDLVVPPREKEADPDENKI
jgi:hypothetical protein